MLLGLCPHSKMGGDRDFSYEKKMVLFSPFAFFNRFLPVSCFSFRIER